MSRKIVIIDYSLGNIFSVQQAFSWCGAETAVSHDPDQIKGADAIVLPGVGAFAEAMNYLREHKLDAAIKESVEKGKPFLGICLGMQLLFDHSEEFQMTEGLGLIKGEIRKFRSSDNTKLHVPQVGWNTINPPKNKNWDNTVIKNMAPDSYVYFVHSYYSVPENKNEILTETTYGGITYCSAVHSKNIIATQFHPEKSGEAGLSIYKNWLNTI